MTVDREAIRARAESATPGDWIAERVYDDIYVVGVDDEGVQDQFQEVCRMGDLTSASRGYSDAVFIAHAKDDVLALLDALDEAEAHRKQLDGFMAGDVPIKRLLVENGMFDLEIDASDYAMKVIAACFARSLADTLDTAGAENYTETRFDMTVRDPETRKQFVVTVQRAGKLTPHEARRKAEARAADWCREALICRRIIKALPDCLTPAAVDEIKMHLGAALTDDEALNEFCELTLPAAARGEW